MFLTGKTWEIERSEANDVKGRVISRMVAAQPLLFGKTKNNLRRISELWCHLSLCGEDHDVSVSLKKEVKNRAVSFLPLKNEYIFFFH